MQLNQTGQINCSNALTLWLDSVYTLKKEAVFLQLYLGEMSKLSIQIQLKMLLKVL